MNLSFRLLNNIFGWGIFLIAAFTYCSTIESTTSFWDCGEYIACAYKLEVGHPPGAPTFLIIGRAFSLMAADESMVAYWVNMSSALSSAFTILFMFWSLTLLGRRLVNAMGQAFEGGRMWAVLGSAAIGSLAYTFSDSFWFSAVEGEVYAMSSFFTAVVFWAILRWDADDSDRADRWLVFIAYMVGLSIGVHLLNLLAIPAIVFVVYFKKYKPSTQGVLLTGVISVILLGAIQNGIIPGIVSGIANYELFFVNTFGLPFNSGTIIFMLLLIGFVVSGIYYTVTGSAQVRKIFYVSTGLFFLFAFLGGLIYTKYGMIFITAAATGGLIYYFRNNLRVLNTALMSFAVLLIGYSTIAVLVIRSQANTPMDENNPENAISLLSYLNREQYGDWPLLYGPYYNAMLDDQNPADDGVPVYGRNEVTGEYGIVDSRKQSIYNFDEELSTLLPRMWEMNNRSHVPEYEYWGNVKKNRRKTPYVDPKTANTEDPQPLYVPTMGANLRYMFKFQMGWMYWRYFGWNFVGRQNDIQGHQPGLYGESMSGITALDGSKMKNQPVRLANNKARNAFFYLPLLLGIIGLLFHFSRDWRSALVVLLLFLFTGLAIVFYLNQYPLQPRERDYAYVGSFFAFAMWIGMGVYAIYDLLSTRAKVAGIAGAGLATVLGSGVPFIMAKQGWDDHNRSHRYTARDFAKNYLSSCAKNAILFTNGDNDTFPLWYCQEVEGYRTDVRVLNLSLLNTDWYIDQARRKAYDSDALPFSLTANDTRQGLGDQVFLGDAKAPAMDVSEAMRLIHNRDQQALELRRNQDDDKETFIDTLYRLPTRKFYLTVDKAAARATGAIPANMPDSLVLDRIEWTINKSYLLKSELMMMDLLATGKWKRPMYFAVTAGNDSYLGLDDYFQLEGLAYRLVPMRGDRRDEFAGGVVRCQPEKMYNTIMKDFKWGGLQDTTVSIYMDENNRRFTTNQRLQITSLARFLIDDGMKDKAVTLLDSCQRWMPVKHVPYEPVMTYMVEQYYRGGAPQKANKLSKSLAAYLEEEIRYTNRIMLKAQNAGEDADRELSRLEFSYFILYRNARDNGQTEIANELAKKAADMGIDFNNYEQPQRPQMQLPPAIQDSVLQPGQMPAAPVQGNGTAQPAAAPSAAPAVPAGDKPKQGGNGK
ncbi:MAG: MFS transporter [Bacteroidetes bacterium]|nr:MFS transporter [Bacteroidota bacterium]